MGRMGTDGKAIMNGIIVIKKAVKIPDTWIIWDGLEMVATINMENAGRGDRRRILTALVREYAADVAEGMLDSKHA